MHVKSTLCALSIILRVKNTCACIFLRSSEFGLHEKGVDGLIEAEMSRENWPMTQHTNFIDPKLWVARISPRRNSGQTVDCHLIWMHPAEESSEVPTRNFAIARYRVFKNYMIVWWKVANCCYIIIDINNFKRHSCDFKLNYNNGSHFYLRSLMQSHPRYKGYFRDILA